MKQIFIVLILVWIGAAGSPHPLVPAATDSLKKYGGVATEEPCGGNAWIYSVALSPDGKSVLAGWDPDVARLWDLKTGAVLQDFVHNTHSAIYSVAFSPDGKSVLTGVWGEAALWDVRTGARLRTFPEEGKASDGTRASFSPYGAYVLTQSAGGAALWDVKTGKKVRIFPGNINFGHTGPAKMSSDGKYVLVSDLNDEEGFVWRLWDVRSGAVVRTLHTGPAAFTPDGRSILASGKAGLVLLDVENPGRSRVLDTEPALRFWKFSADGRYALAFTEWANWDIVLWDLRTYRRLVIFPVLGHNRVTWEILPNGKQIIIHDTLEMSDKVRLWDIATGHTVRKIDDVGPGAFSADSRWLIGIGVRSLYLLDLTTGEKVREYC